MTLCFTDIETRETFRRLKEIAFAYGSHGSEPLCETLQDYMAHLKAREKKRLRWERRSPQLRHRRNMISFIMKVCQHERFSSDTTYQAVYLYDRFTDRHHVVECQLFFVAIICVVLSGKLLEVDQNIPRYGKMPKFIPQYRPAQFETFLGLEKYVLGAFGCDILVPTEVNFLQYFMLFAVDGKSSWVEEANNNALPAQSDPPKKEVDMSDFVPFPNVKGADLVERIRGTAMLILQELSRLEPTNEFPPSWIAASILMFARREHSLNFWTPKLKAVTSYTLAEVQCCLRAYIEPNFNAAAFKCEFTPADYCNTNQEVFILIGDTETETESDNNNNNK